jgi:hypothetical protein
MNPLSKALFSANYSDGTKLKLHIILDTIGKGSPLDNAGSFWHYVLSARLNGGVASRIDPMRFTIGEGL